MQLNFTKPQIAMLKSNNFSATYRIYYEDTDAGGVVYYANYLKFFERARTDFLRSLGISQSNLAEVENLVFVVKRCEIEYISPAKLDDLIDVSVEIKELRGASIVMEQIITMESKMIASLTVVVVCVGNNDFKTKKIPFDIRNLLSV